MVVKKWIDCYLGGELPGRGESLLLLPGGVVVVVVVAVVADEDVKDGQDGSAYLPWEQ